MVVAYLGSTHISVNQVISLAMAIYGGSMLAVNWRRAEERR